MRKWTPEERLAQAEKIRAHKPWEKSTGPKTEAGKKRVAQNAFKHGMDSALTRELRQLLKRQNELLKNR